MASFGNNPLLIGNNTLREGFCEKECGYAQWIFLFLLFLSVVASFASGIPSQQVCRDCDRKNNIIDHAYVYHDHIRMAKEKQKKECEQCRSECLNLSFAELVSYPLR